MQLQVAPWTPAKGLKSKIRAGYGVTGETGGNSASGRTGNPDTDSTRQKEYHYNFRIICNLSATHAPRGRQRAPCRNTGTTLKEMGDAFNTNITKMKHRQ